MGQEHDEIATQLNLVFDESDDYISAETESIINHRYTAGILEVHTEYSNGDKKFYPIDLIKDDMMQLDMGSATTATLCQLIPQTYPKKTPPDNPH